MQFTLIVQPPLGAHYFGIPQLEIIDQPPLLNV